MTTWIRMQNKYSQFDHPKGAPHPADWEPVPNYPEHVGSWARDPKPRTDKGGVPAARIEAPKPTPKPVDVKPALKADDKANN